MNKTEKYNETFIELATFLQALAHPARLQIVEHLAKYHECPAGAISSELPLSKSTVSQHMTKLREAGLIFCNPSGVCQNYRLNMEKLNEMMKYPTWILPTLVINEKVTARGYIPSVNIILKQLKTNNLSRKDADTQSFDN